MVPIKNHFDPTLHVDFWEFFNEVELINNLLRRKPLLFQFFPILSRLSYRSLRYLHFLIFIHLLAHHGFPMNLLLKFIRVTSGGDCCVEIYALLVTFWALRRLKIWLFRSITKPLYIRAKFPCFWKFQFHILNIDFWAIVVHIYKSPTITFIIKCFKTWGGTLLDVYGG